jgi:trans-aconitate 2-methyltransferase
MNDTSDSYTTDQVVEFYDHFADYQEQSGINDRHGQLFRWMQKFGLKPQHAVLEIGCGSGQLTQLISEFCREGEVVGFDISPQNIKRAAARLAGFKHTRVSVSDVTQEPIQGSFDRIIIPDVLEHIPVAGHKTVFRAAASVLKPEGKLVIHIPHPCYLDYMRVHAPEKLQIIDQSLSAAQLITDAEEAGFNLAYFESYALHFQPADYQIMMFEPAQRAYHPTQKSYLQRVLLRLRLRGLRK